MPGVEEGGGGAGRRRQEAVPNQIREALMNKWMRAVVALLPPSPALAVWLAVQLASWASPLGAIQQLRHVGLKSREASWAQVFLCVCPHACAAHQGRGPAQPVAGHHGGHGALDGRGAHQDN